MVGCASLPEVTNLEGGDLAGGPVGPPSGEAGWGGAFLSVLHNKVSVLFE